jgi:hypothetical protein
LPHGSIGVPRQIEGVARTPDETVEEAQRLLDANQPFHAHEVFEDAWKSGASGDSPEAGLWKALAQLAVGVTHRLRGNAVGGQRTVWSPTSGHTPTASTSRRCAVGQPPRTTVRCPRFGPGDRVVISSTTAT